MVSSNLHCRFIDGCRKLNQYSVLVDMETGRQLNGGTRVAYALKTPVVGSKRDPALHATNIQLSIDRTEAASMRSRPKITRKWNNRALHLLGHFVSQQKKMSAESERKMQELAVQWSPSSAGYLDLTSAGIIQTARHIGQRQLGDAAVPGA